MCLVLTKISLIFLWMIAALARPINWKKEVNDANTLSLKIWKKYCYENCYENPFLPLCLHQKNCFWFIFHFISWILPNLVKCTYKESTVEQHQKMEKKIQSKRKYCLGNIMWKNIIFLPPKYYFIFNIQICKQT